MPNHYVFVEASAVPAVVCTPAKETNLELGVTVVAESAFSFGNFGTLLVHRMSDSPEAVTVGQ